MRVRLDSSEHDTKKILDEIVEQRNELDLERQYLRARLEANEGEDEALDRIEARLRDILASKGVTLDLEPSTPRMGTRVGTKRKPNAGSLRAAKVLDIMKRSTREWWSIAEIQEAAGEEYNLVSYAVTKLEKSGDVKKESRIEQGHGRPRVFVRLRHS